MEENILQKFSISEACPVRNVLDRFGDKWSILLILILGDVEKMRFNELHKTVGTISQKMLSTTLKSLEADGLVNRHVYPEIPPRVEYNITERGRSLLPHIQNLVGWASEHMADIALSRKAYAS